MYPGSAGQGLTLKAPSKICNRQQSKKKFFSEKISLEISCEWSALKKKIKMSAVVVIETFRVKCGNNRTGLLVAHFENIGFHIGSSYSKYRLFIGFSIKNIG